MSPLVNPALGAALPSRRALLAERLRQAAGAPGQRPLSFAQQRLWFLDQLEPNSPLYNIASVARVTGDLNVAALEQSFNAVVARHEAVRTRFVCPDGIPLQVSDGPKTLQVRLVDLQACPDPEKEKERKRLTREEINRPFNLSQDQLLRVTLLRLAPQESQLILVLHHIIADEWSLRVLFKELAELYRGLVAGQPARLPELPIQYADFALWQRDWLQGPVLAEQLAYWKQHLGGSLPVTELFTDRPRRSTPSFRGGNESRLLGKALEQKLKQLAHRQEATLFMVLLAGFKALLYRYTQQEDLVVGSPIAGRTRVETEELIGFFVNTLPLRTRLDGNPAFTELLRRVREVTLAGYAHQHVPFERLVEELQPERSLDHNPFTRLMFVVQNDLLETLELPGARLEFLDVESDLAKFDLTLVVQETRRGLMARVEYNRDLFDGATAARLLQHYEVLLQGIAAAPQQRLAELPLLTPAERQQLLVEWNNTTTDYPRDKTIHELFEAQARRAPNAPAVVFGERTLTYGELNARANQLAAYLRKCGVNPDVPVGICVNRSPEMVLGLLAILKAGGAYVPLDAAYPAERLAFMLEDTQTPVLLTQQELLARLPAGSAQRLCLDSDWDLVAQAGSENLPRVSGPENLAYIMYTSGSTGRPKGVAVPHRAVVRLVQNTNFIELDATDRIGQVSNISFDAATFEVWGALLNGGQLRGIAKDVALSPADFARELREQGITALFLTAALFNQLAAEAPGALETLRTAMAGGEALDPNWVRTVLRQRPPQRLVNGYGPTENTTFTCCYWIRELSDEAANVPIGRPIANTQVYILDRRLNPVPVGVPGELYAGGDGLARGYWNRPELTAEKFVPNPFSPPGQRQQLYRTGDLARYLPDGNIEFLGRLDQQVKIRGFRIELGEIEAVLGQHPAVRECVVAVNGTASDNRRLAAYVVPEANGALNAGELREFLARKLPDYMVPAFFVSLPALPLTPNGKLDRKALPAPEQGRPALERKYMAPRDEVEQRLAGIWEEVLGVQPVGVEDRFFDLGGHSLLAVKLVAQIQKSFGRKLRLATIFQAPSVRQLAAILRDEVKERSLLTGTSLVELQGQGSRPPFYVVHGAGGGMFWGYANLSRCFGPDQPVYVFKSRGMDGREEFSRLEEMAAQYVADLCQVQPRGPYFLGGYCFGGNVAYEMARQLAAQGKEVAFLALFNCAPPNSRYHRIPWSPLWAARLVRNLFVWAGLFRRWTPQQRGEFLRSRRSAFKRLMLRFRSGFGDMSAVQAGDLVDMSSFNEEEQRLWAIHIEALLQFHPQPYPGRVHLFRSAVHPLWCSFDPDYGWKDLAQGGVVTTVVPGAHEEILEEPWVETLARELALALQGSVAAGVSPAVEGGILPPGSARAVSNAGTLRPAVPPGETHGSTAGETPAATNGLGPRMEFPLHTTYAQQFVAQVEKTPQAVAACCKGESLTYAELNARANQLAHQLQALGVGPEVLVGICLERSLELMVALLGVLKAGGAYLPLAPSYPTERLAYMLTDSKAPVLVTQAALRNRLPEFQGKILLATGVGQQFAQLKAAPVAAGVSPRNSHCDLLPGSSSSSCSVEAEPDRGRGEARQNENCSPAGTHWPVSNPPCAATPGSLAYVLYTSGSTGVPKGVQITQRALLNHNFAAREAFHLKPTDRVLQFAPLSFDISVEEIFPSWLAGAAVVLRTDEVISSGAKFLSFLVEEKVTVLNLPTAYWQELTEWLQSGAGTLADSVRLVVIGGEQAPLEVCRRWQQCVRGAVQLLNSYGVTEATVTTTIYEARPAEDSLPIGKPIANTQVVLLDEGLQPVPDGMPGELCIGGAGVGRGYLNRPELTAKQFIPNPWPEKIRSERLYRTGDRARFRPDGNLEFLGRLDEQVKIRGYRIEPGEIEAVLLQHPAIKEAAVAVREESPERKRLVAYCALRQAAPLRIHELIHFLKDKLPEYMLPTAFVALEQLPRTPAGKLDRRGLPAPDKSRPALEEEFVPARTRLEEVLGSIWSQVLDVSPVGVNDNFIELGGESLLATQIISRIRESCRAEVSLEQFFAQPTVRGLAGLLSGQVLSRPEALEPPLQPVPRSAEPPLSFVQERLWFFEQLQPGSHAYNVPLALRLKGRLTVGALQRAFREVLCRHEALRTTFRDAEGCLSQVIRPEPQAVLEVVELAGLTAENRETRIQEFVNAEARKPFDLTRGPLLRALLLRLGSAEHVLMVVMHHSISDGWSQVVFFRELEAYYQAFAAEERGGDGSSPRPEGSVERSGDKLSPPVAPLPVQYADFAVWQRQTLQGKRLEQELAYWKEKLAGAPAALDLPSDWAEPKEPSGKAARCAALLPESVAQAMTAETQRAGCTPFMFLMSALVITLHKWSGQKDLVIGTVVAGRNRRELENVLGCFMNFLPLRTRLAGTESGQELLAQIRATVLEAQTHQDCPFEKMVEAINPKRGLNQNPFYNVALLLQNFPADLFRAPGLQVEPMPVAMEAALLDLRFEAEQTRHGFSLNCEYRTDLFSANTIQQLLASYCQVLESLVHQPALRVSDFQLGPALLAQAKAARRPKERQLLALAATFTAEPLADSLRYWFRELELAVDVEFAPYNQVFQQLLDPASLLSTNLRGLNVLCLRLEDWEQAGAAPAAGSPPSWQENLRRSAGEVVGALKAAAARNRVPCLVCLCPPSDVVAADPERSRVLAGLEHDLVAQLAGLSGVFTLSAQELAQWYPVADYYDRSGHELGHMPFTPLFYTALGTALVRKFHALNRPATKVIVLDCDQTLWAGVCGEDGARGVRLDPSYLALQQFFCAQRAAGKLLCLCSKNNPADVQEVFAQRPEMPLRYEQFAACRLNWRSKAENLKSLAQQLQLGLESFAFIDDNPVECAEVEANCPEVLTLQLPEDPALIPQFLQHCWIFDQLKLTEEDRRRASFYRQEQQREQLRAASLSLADFLAGLELKVSFEPMSPAQVSRVAQLSQRTNQFNCTTRRMSEAEVQALTTAGEGFTVCVSDRFGDYGLVGVVVCKTVHPLLEVESFLLSCRVLGRGVEHHVLARLGALARERGLEALRVQFVPTARNKPALEFLQSVGAAFQQDHHGGLFFRFPAGFAAQVTYQPPAVLAPSISHPLAGGAEVSGRMPIPKFSRCRAIALEANTAEKIHRLIQARQAARPERTTAYVAPQTPLQRQLCELWQSLLGVPQVGVRDDFFELGGHSLLAVRLFGQVEKLTGRKLPLVTVFQAPTVEQLACLLTEAKAPRAGSLLVPIQPQGNKPPLFLVHGAGGDVLWGYANLAACLPGDQPIYGIKSRAQIGLEEFANLEEMARGYLQAIREFQPQSPYYLGGYCFGGNVAYEMARQLHDQGQEVALLALLDASPANIGYETLTWWQPGFPFRFVRNFYYWLADFIALSGQERRSLLARKARTFGRKLKRRLGRQQGVVPFDVEEVIDPAKFPEKELEIWRIHLQALDCHVERPYPGDVMLLRTRGQGLFCSLQPDFCWRRVVGGTVTVKVIPGAHENIFMEPNVKALAKELTSLLEQAQRRYSNHQ